MVSSFVEILGAVMTPATNESSWSHVLGIKRSAYFPSPLLPVALRIISAAAASASAMMTQGFMLSTSFYVNMTVIQEARASAFL